MVVHRTAIFAVVVVQASEFNSKDNVEQDDVVRDHDTTRTTTIDKCE